jgi:hypothetical protein
MTDVIFVVAIVCFSVISIVTATATISVLLCKPRGPIGYDSAKTLEPGPAVLSTIKVEPQGLH